MFYVVSKDRVEKELDTGMSLLSKLSLEKEKTPVPLKASLACIQ